MNFMHEDALIRKGPAFGPWAIPAVIGAVAVLVGVVVGQGGWYFVPAACLLPLLWFWPVESAMGVAVLLLPFEYVTLLGVSSGGDSDRSLMSVALLLAFWYSGGGRNCRSPLPMACGHGRMVAFVHHLGRGIHRVGGRACRWP